LARELADVLHHLLPEAAPLGVRSPRRLLLPAESGNRFGAAVLWNLGVELRREGIGASVRFARSDTEDYRPPASEREQPRSPLLPTLESVETKDLSGLAEPEVREDVALIGAQDDWVLQAPPGALAGSAVLLLATPTEQCSSRVHELVDARFAGQEAVRLGITIHGVRGLEEARDAFDALADDVEAQHGVELTSYGFLLEDVQLYRAHVGQQPVSLCRPGSPAAITLADVARTLCNDFPAWVPSADD